MRTTHCLALFSLVVWAVADVDAQDATPNPPKAWGSAKVQPVSRLMQHSIHAYFNASPESPDGRWVLFYASTTPTGHEGEIRIVERSTGKETVLARDVVVEDAHRAACQQWVCGGKRVVFHNLLKSGEAVVMCVDLDGQRQRLLARGRQVGFGQPHANIVPIYAPHWNPGERRDLELLDVDSGAINTALKAATTIEGHEAWVGKHFETKDVSIYIPMLSPDLSRVFFKLARPAGGDVRSAKASVREGLLCCDLKTGRLQFVHERWGHPAWHPDSRHILNVGGRIIDSNDGSARLIPNYPKLPGSHPSFNPDGKLFTSDLQTPDKNWAVGVGDVATGAFTLVHTFDNSKGARSWRVSHPHPVFNAAGNRLYFNVSVDDWTRLYVAEIAKDR